MARESIPQLREVRGILDIKQGSPRMSRTSNAVVYGGTGAVGSAISVALAMSGASVHIVGMNEDRLDVVMRTIKDLGCRATSASVDVMDSAAVSAHARDVELSYGSVDIAINALGFDRGSVVHVCEAPEPEILAPVNAHLRGLLAIASAVRKPMARQGKGSIISVTSSFGVRPVAGCSAFSIASASLEALSKCLALELGREGIRVAAVRCEPIPETVQLRSHTARMYSELSDKASTGSFSSLVKALRSKPLLDRELTLADVAQACVFLASPGAEAFTGTVLNLSMGAELSS